MQAAGPTVDNMYSVSSGAVAANCEGKLITQMQWASGVEGNWVQDANSPQMWSSPYTITVPQGFRFVFAHVGIGWTNGNIYEEIVFNVPLVTEVQGVIRCYTSIANLNGMLVPQFICVFEKIN